MDAAEEKVELGSAVLVGEGAHTRGEGQELWYRCWPGTWHLAQGSHLCAGSLQG